MTLHPIVLRFMLFVGGMMRGVDVEANQCRSAWSQLTLRLTYELFPPQNNIFIPLVFLIFSP